MSADLRIASADDVATCRDLFFTSYNDLHRRYGQEQEDPEEHGWLDDALAHLLETDPHGTVLALRDGEPCGFASSYRRDAFWFLSFLFVHPTAQGEGIGRALLEAVLPSEELTRALVVESFQPTSTGLYASYGITPRSVRYRLTGPTDPARLPAPPAEVQVQPLTNDDLPEIAELDRRRLGYGRSQDHAWWSSAMEGWAYRRGDELVGYAYREAGGRVGPALGGDEATLSAIVADVLSRSEDTSTMSVPVHGGAGALFRSLVRAGARIEPSGYLFLYCSSGDPLPPTYVDFAGYLP